jgi:hypothetical protein
MSYCAIPALIIIPWLVFSYAYFGTVVPTSITGKLALYSHMSIDSTWTKLGYLLGLHSSLGWIMLSAAICGAWWLHQKQNFGKIEIIWLAVMIAFYATSRTALFFWYVVPIYPIYIIFVAAALPFLWDRLGSLAAQFPAIRIGIGVFLASGVLYMGNSQVEYYKNYARYLREVHQSIGIYLRDKADPTHVVAARYIGNTGYYSGLKILDRDGMVSPEAAEYNRKGDYAGLVLDYRPEWVVAAPDREGDEFASTSEFLDNYHLVKSFGWEDRVRHNLYRKID